MFVCGSNILKSYTKEKSYFCGSMLYVTVMRVLAIFSVIADISLVEF